MKGIHAFRALGDVEDRFITASLLPDDAVGGAAHAAAFSSPFRKISSLPLDKPASYPVSYRKAGTNTEIFSLFHRKAKKAEMYGQKRVS